MRKSKYTEEQIIGFLRQAEAGMAVKELGRKHGFSDASFYKWRAKYGGMNVPDASTGSTARLDSQFVAKPRRVGSASVYR